MNDKIYTQTELEIELLKNNQNHIFKKYIEHEVRIRVHDEKFKMIEKKFDSLDNKLNFIIGIVLSSVIIPVGLHLFKLI